MATWLLVFWAFFMGSKGANYHVAHLQPAEVGLVVRSQSGIQPEFHRQILDADFVGVEVGGAFIPVFARVALVRRKEVCVVFLFGGEQDRTGEGGGGGKLSRHAWPQDHDAGR